MEQAMTEMLPVALAAFVTLFVVIDPVGLLPIFMVLTDGADDALRRAAARRGVLVSVAVLFCFGLFGENLLKGLGIGLPAFKVAGGIMLFLIAAEMVFERRTERRHRSAQEFRGQAETAMQDDISVFPLAIPLIAGPGAITTVLLLVSDQSGKIGAQAAVLLVLGVILALCYGLLRLASVAERFAGPTMIKVLTRLLGIILAALATQYVLDGLRSYWLPPH